MEAEEAKGPDALGADSCHATSHEVKPQKRPFISEAGLETGKKKSVTDNCLRKIAWRTLGIGGGLQYFRTRVNEVRRGDS